MKKYSKSFAGFKVVRLGELMSISFLGRSFFFMVGSDWKLSLKLNKAGV